MAYDDGPIRHLGGRPAAASARPRWRPAQARISQDIERAERNPHLRDHLSETERIRIGTRQHPVVLLKPGLAVLAAFALLLRSLTDGSALSSTQDVFLLAFIGTLLWLGARWLQWSRHFFLATDQRVLKMYGVLSTTVDSMKVQKVTDMKYHRSFLGELVGYGSITIESAGQDQALHNIDYIPYPRENYQELCHIIIGEDPRSGGRKKHRFRRRLETMARRSRSEASGDWGYEVGYPDDIDYGDEPDERTVPPVDQQRMLYSSSEGRTAETSPIPIYPPGYFAGRDDGDADEDYHNDPTRS